MSTFEERARARASWPVRKVTLAEEGSPAAYAALTVDERIALVEVLTREQWAFAGLEIPSYTRAEMPGRVIRPERK